MKITLDAKNEKIGRLASKVAALLRGKDLPSFAKNVVPSVTVHVENASLLKLTDKKKRNVKYRSYTGYPGGLKEQSLGELITKKGIEEVLRKAVYGMLPGNKLRSRIIKNLHITK